MSPRGRDGLIPVYLETADRKAFACAVDWPGWSRAGKTGALALEALIGSAPRYAIVAREAGLELPTISAGGFEIVERVRGGAGTEFGVPSVVADVDRRPASAVAAARTASLVVAAWTVFDRVVAGAPAELRKGPRGGGRDRDKIVGHVVESDWYYSREIGLRLPNPARDDRPAVLAMRSAVLEILGQPSDGSPLADRRWPAGYAARRIAWHAIDHAWEIEDRVEPAG